MNGLFQALTSAADGAFVINNEQHIIYWNQAAQDVLGFAYDEVAHQPCYEILAGCDERGQLICREHCQVAATTFAGNAVRNFDASVRTKADGRQWVNISTFTFPISGDGTELVLVHLFRDVSLKKQKEQFIDQVLTAVKNLQIEVSLQAGAAISAGSRPTDLTDREREVLSLLAQGLNTSDIARSLAITSSTVRNHIRNILQKLQVHSRLEAVVYAFEYGLVSKD